MLVYMTHASAYREIQEIATHSGRMDWSKASPWKSTIPFPFCKTEFRFRFAKIILYTVVVTASSKRIPETEFGNQKPPNTYKYNVPQLQGWNMMVCVETSWIVLE